MVPFPNPGTVSYTAWDNLGRDRSHPVPLGWDWDSKIIYYNGIGPGRVFVGQWDGTKWDPTGLGRDWDRNNRFSWDGTGT